MTTHKGVSKMYKKLILLTIVPVLLVCSSVFACTHFVLVAKDGSIVLARTMEFGAELNSHIVTSPVGTTIQSPSPTGNDGMTWTSKYGYVMMDFFGSKHPVDGMNEEGLSMGYLYLPGYTKYQTVPKGANSDALFYLYVGDWVLGNFKTVEEVKKAIKDVYVFSKPVTYGDIKNVVFPVHLTVSDKSGKSIVVEWVNGKTNIYDNPLGVLTNSPEFPWQLNNLKNYVNISPHSPDPLELDGIEYTATGQGSGATGIPGDFTPPSRFVKIMYLAKSCFPVETGEETVNLADHIMNNVDIPIGAVQGEKGAKDDLPDRTQWTVFKDLTNNKLYFKSYENTTLQVIDLNKVDFAMGAKVLDIPLDSKQIFVDATDRFLQSSSEK